MGWIVKVGIIGLPLTGKTTLFNALTRGKAPVTKFAGSRNGANLGVIAVPDGRFDLLVNEYRPKKVSPASVQVIDGAAPIGVDRQESFGTDFFTGIRSVDALIHVVRAFEDPSIPQELDPLADVRKVNDELTLADLQVTESRLERLNKSLRNRKVPSGSPALVEKDLVLRVQSHLMEGKPLSEIELSVDESKLIKSFDFLTLKPMLIVANVSEGGSSDLEGLKDYCRAENLELIELTASVEAEIAQLPEHEEKEYLAAMGIECSARDRLVQSAYRALGLLSFFTVGEDEVRAWTINEGTRALDAAGKIHSDLARGFVRAEVLAYEDSVRVGHWDAAKSSGLIRLEGKEYVVLDGDIMSIRFKV